MPINNGAMDVTEKRISYYTNQGATATGVTGIICVVPSSCSLDAAQVVAFGLSGAPNIALVVNRFIVGTGATAFTIAVGTSNVMAAYGTSGPGLGVGTATFGMCIPAIGSTLTTLLANDVLSFQTGVANTAVTGLAVNVVLRPLGEFTHYFGVV